MKFSIFRSKDDPFCLGYVPLLQTVSIINTALSWQKMLKLSELLGKTAISNLHLNFRSEKIWVKPEGRRQLLPVFHKLRIVNLLNIPEECDLTWTMFLLEGAPNLKELRIVGSRGRMAHLARRRTRDWSGNHLHLISSTTTSLGSVSMGGFKQKTNS